MSEETKKTAPAAEAEQQPAAAPEATAEQAAPAQEPAAEEAADPKDDKKKDGGWFNKKAREMEAVKAKLDVAEQNAAQAKEQLLRMAAEYDNYRKRSTREADQKFNDGGQRPHHRRELQKGCDHDAGQGRQGAGRPPCGGDRSAGQAL